jgi:hypothetical protein
MSGNQFKLNGTKESSEFGCASHRTLDCPRTTTGNEMQQGQLQIIAIGAGLTALVMAIVTGRLPRWLRVVLVLGLAILAAGTGLYAYRYTTKPTTLTVAAGSADGEAVRLMSVIAARLAATGAPVRLQVVDKGNALEASKAFSGGQTDLAVIRADSGDLSSAETVVVVTLP